MMLVVVLSFAPCLLEIREESKAVDVKLKTLQIAVMSITVIASSFYATAGHSGVLSEYFRGVKTVRREKDLAEEGITEEELRIAFRCEVGLPWAKIAHSCTSRATGSGNLQISALTDSTECLF